ncbi:MAG: BF3164 family lipoprotein, partial [Lentimicrobiaceae bacterium]|nr:BF3164 family lipoprotein [Lentimicrobiaceae bacterium]
MIGNSIKLLSVFLFSFGACSNNITKTPENETTFNKFPLVQLLDENDFMKFDTINPDGLLLFQDTILIIRNRANSSKYHFSSINLNTRNFISHHIESGYKTGQSLGFLSWGIISSNLWVSDLNKQKIILSPLFNPDKKSGESKEMQLPVFYYSIQMDSDSTLIGSGNYDSDYKLTRLNLSTGKVLDEMIPYHKAGSENLAREEKMAYESFLCIKPSANKCVLACRYADQIEVIDLDRRKSIIIKGPNGFEPDVEVLIGNDGKKMISRNNDTSLAAVSLKATDNYIYVLFSGNR